MLYDNYKNTMPFPHKRDYTVTYYYKNGACIAKKAPTQEILSAASNFTQPIQAKDLQNSVTEECVDQKALLLDTTKWRQIENDLEARFKADAFEELGISDEPAREVLMEKAWEMAHPEGYEAIFYALEDLVDLLYKIKQAQTPRG